MSESKKTQFKGVMGWIDHRLPIFSFMKHQGEYKTPRNLSYMWSFGSIAGIGLMIQIITGIMLAMHYTPHVDHAFDSVERIMRDVEYGWLLRYIHAVGASMFFVAVYAHIIRGLYYGSYKSPRELLWWIGIIIFLTMMATAFMGYVLPWGQMSFWGATVITNLFSSLDQVVDGMGTSIVQWLWGGFSVDNPTLNRFFALHYLLPFVIVGVVILHLVALHTHGSNNPTGVEVKSDADTIPFHPYYTIKDMFGFGLFFLIFFYFVFFAPNYLGHPDNYIPANPLSTPAHIVPEWYFLPFYAILRAVPDKLGGVALMFGSIIILFFLPWLDSHKVKSGKYRPFFKIFFWLFVINGIFLGWLGAKPAEGDYVIMARVATLYYFAYFLIVLPLLSKHEKAKSLPKSISEACKMLLIAGFVLVSSVSPAGAASDQMEPKQVVWNFDGVTGSFDKQSIQRGFQVYKEVCAACHSLRLVAYRNLQQVGFSEAEVKAIAAEKSVMDGPNDAGEMFERPALPSDKFVSPYANDKAAKAANNGALPPDLSLMVKARHDGANYVYSLLTGYQTAPADVTLSEGLSYNPYFPGGQIAMAPPLSDGAVSYSDGTTASVDQMSKDVVNFLQWAAEPEMEHRKEMGIKVLLFLVVFTVLFYLAKKRIWSRLD